jgi:hypothetical protein
MITYMHADICTSTFFKNKKYIVKILKNVKMRFMKLIIHSHSGMQIHLCGVQKVSPSSALLILLCHIEQVILPF